MIKNLQTKLELAKMPLEERINLASSTDDSQILKNLKTDIDFSVINALSQNPNTPKEVLSDIWKMKNIIKFSGKVLNLNKNFTIAFASTLVQNIAIHPNCTEEITINIYDEYFPNVNNSKRVYGSEYDERVLKELAVAPCLPEKIIRTFATHQKTSLREGVAKNMNLPLDLFESLSTDEKIAVRENIIKNPNLPAHIVFKMLQDPDTKIKLLASRHPKCKIETYINEFVQ